MSRAARLVWERPGGEPLEFALAGDSYIVGRDAGSDVCIDEPLVSRAHARLERRGGQWFVIDLGSTNRTRVNGAVVSGEWPLAAGDELRFARARCLFLGSEALLAAETAAAREPATGE